MRVGARLRACPHCSASTPRPLSRRVDGWALAHAPVETIMPERKTLERAAKDRREGKAATTQAGEFVREEMHHVREGKHGARSTKQAIAIGLSKARRAGVDLKPPKKGATSERTRKSAARAYAAGHDGAKKPVSRRRSRAVESALQRE